ncbi:MAG: S9 family peptidase [Bacteroidia bacterium]|nr:S9 family peptidase [Bacteroidia bacterium]
MKKIFLIASTAMLFACNNKPMDQKKITIQPAPQAHKDVTVDDYFGTKVADPYRWLENDTAAEVVQWVKDQNKTTQHYLEQIPYRDQIKKRLTEIWNFPKYTAPFKEGDYYYFSKNDGLQNQNVLYRTKQIELKEGADDVELFLDPNKFSADGTVSLASLAFSKDHKHVAVGIATSGSDWNQVFVMDVATKKNTDDTIEWVKFSGAAWRGNGFYYSRYDEPVKGKAFSNQNEYMKIYYHTLGTPQHTDELVYEDKNHPLRYFNASLSEDERFLFINVSEGTSGTEILIKDLGKKETKFTTLFKGFANNYAIVNNDGDRILAYTDYEAPRYRLISVDPKNADPKNWKEIIPQSKDLLETVASAGEGQLIAVYLSNASTRLKHYTCAGKFMKDITLPGIGTASTGGSKKGDHLVPYSYVSFTNPGTINVYNLQTQKQETWKSSAAEAKFKPLDFETKQVFYPGKDGTKIPMFIIHKKGLKLDGNNPTLLYGYGGFNISLTPSFSVSRIMFLEQGGVYVIANLRGGGEYGEDWHKAGMLNKKQNVFDDFIAAAEYLIKEKYTASKKLAINGGSNGGLLVGACLTQRPDLFQVAIPAVGVLDMLRYHKFTIGWGWAVEYGSSDKKDQFENLLKYSPLHNVKDNVSYPATMIMTADHDDRVVPAHSFKFAATLMAKPHDENKPILIRIDTKAGHGAGKPTTKMIEDVTDMYSFILWNLGVREFDI